MNIYYYIGKLLEKKKKYNLAMKFYSLVKIDKTGIVNYRIGYCHDKLKKYKQSVMFYKKSLILGTSNPHWYIDCGKAFLAIPGTKMEKEKNAIDALGYLKKGIKEQENKISKTNDFVKKSLENNQLEKYEKLKSDIISDYRDYVYFNEAKEIFSLDSTNKTRDEKVKNAEKALAYVKDALHINIREEYAKLELEIIESYRDYWYYKDAKSLLSSAKTVGEEERNAYDALLCIEKALEISAWEEYQVLEDEILEKYAKVFIESMYHLGNKIVIKVSITMFKNIEHSHVKILLQSRMTSLMNSNDLLIDTNKIEKGLDNKCVVTCIIDMALFKVTPELLIINLDIYVLIKGNKYRVVSSDDYKSIYRLGNYDFVPYSTKHKYLSFMWIRRKPLLSQVCKKKKILFLLYRVDFKGDVTKGIINLINALAEYGYDVTLTTMVCANRENQFPVSPLVTFDYIALSSHENQYLPKNEYSAEERISQYYMNSLENYFKYKSVHIVNMPIYGREMHQALLRTIPSDIDIIISDYSGWRYAFYLDFLKLGKNKLNLKRLELTGYIFDTLNKVTSVHLVNPLVEDAFLNIAEEKAKIITIPNIVPIKTKLLDVDQSLWERNKTVILVGSLTKVNNFETAINVFSKIIKEYDEWLMEIYGEGSEKENLSNLIYKLELENHVFLKGHISNTYEVFKRSSIQMNVSNRESFGLSMVEAMHSGTIVVSTNKTIGARYLINDEKTGFMAKTNDVENVLFTLKSCMSMFQDKNIKLLEIQENAFNKSILYDNENITKKWSKVIDSFSDKSR